MGKPSSSCLKIIACGSDSPVEDDIEASEARGSGDKRGWSFRKRSARHRVLSNSVTTENLTLGSKEDPQSTSVPNQAPGDLKYPEKVVVLEQPDEKRLPLSSVDMDPAKSIEPELSETMGSNEPPKSVQTEELDISHTPKSQEENEPQVSEAVIASETQELPEPKTHEAVFTSVDIEPLVPTESKTSEAEVTPVELELRETVVASQDDVLEEPMIVDMQAGVRGFLAQRELVKLRSIVKLQAAVRGHLVRRQAVDTLYCMHSIIKVQSLVRARQSKPSDEEIPVNKLVTSNPSVEDLLRNAFARQLLMSTPKSKLTVIKCDPLKPSPSRLWLERWMALYLYYGLANLEKQKIGTDDGQSPTTESENMFKSRSDSVNPEFGKECQAPNLLSNKEKTEQPSDKGDALFEGPLGIAKQKPQSKRTRSRSLSNDLSVETEDPKISTKRMASKQVEVESKKSAHGSKKSSNPAFIAAQSKFKELSSTHQASSDEYHLDTAPSREKESFIKENEPILEPSETRVNIAGSEHGTELSVTSALDSPDLSEAEAVEVDLDVKYSEKKSSNSISNDGMEVKAIGSSIVDASDEQRNGEYVGLEMAADSLQVEHKPEISASPDNSQRTPSGQVSGKVKRGKAGKNGSNGKHSPLSSGKKTPSKPVDDTGVRSSVEKLSKDERTERRRTSFGSAKSENIDQEPRDSTSSTKALPSYMQATSSARAKAHSPRSSPDVQDKDSYIMKKRHSLPGASGRQGSPRVQRPTSQTTPQSQPLKGNANTPPQERKWIR